MLTPNAPLSSSSLISPITYKQLSFESDPHSLIFYDKYYQKNIVLSKNSIKIYNKSGTTLKKTFPLQCKRKNIKSAAIDPDLRYLLLLEFSSPKDSTITIYDMVNLVGEKLTIDFTNLLGMFFIYTHNKGTTMENTPVSSATFCWLFIGKLIIFHVETINDSTMKIKTEHFVQAFTSTNEVASFDYSPEYQILCCEVRNEKFLLYNLSNPLYYDKSHKLRVPCMKKKMSREEIEESKKRKKWQQGMLLISRVHMSEIYSCWQFFLKTLYSHLYFIHLNILDEKITIYQVVDLSTLEQRYELKLQTKKATIQFIDNLIIVHDFEHEVSTIYDIYLENLNNNVYFQECPITNDTLLQRNNNSMKNIIDTQIILNSNSNDSIGDDSYSISLKVNYKDIPRQIPMTDFAHNTMIYYKELYINGVMLEESCIFSSDIFRRTTHYFLSFNSEIYYNTYSNTKTNQSQYQTFDPVINLIRRDYSRETIIKGIIDHITQGKSVRKVNDIFLKIDKILSYQHMRTKAKTNQVINSKPNKPISTTNSVPQSKNASDLPKAKAIFANKNTMITQNDVLASFLKNFEYNSNVKPIYVIEMMIHFAMMLKAKSIPIVDYYNEVLFRFIRKTEEIERIGFYINHILLPGNIPSIGKHFMEQSSSSSSVFQIGIDILIRAKQYEEIVMILIQKGMIREALVFINNNKLCHSFNIIIPKVKEIILLNKVNRSLIRQFLKSNW